MANIQNLIKNEDLTPEQRRQNASKAGKASAKKRKQNKTFNELINNFLNSQVNDERLKEQLIKLGVEDEEVTNKVAITVSMWKQALKGNTRAFELIRDTIGEKPIEKTEQQINNIQRVKIIDDTDEVEDGD